MYEFIKGNLVQISEDKVILECNDIGYSIIVSSNTLEKMSVINNKYMMYIYQHIREDEMTLYGFYDKTERDIFKKLISISGIGPKVSIGIISKFETNEFLNYILKEDVKAISTAPGVGKKTANRIILELKDKFKHHSISESMDNLSETPKNNTRTEAIDALTALGYAYMDASKLVDVAYKEDCNVEELIRKALSIAAINQ